MMFKGERDRSEAVHDVLSERKKDKKFFLPIDLTYYQGNKMCIDTLSCVLHNQARSLNRLKDWNRYVHFQQIAHVYPTFTAMRTTELNRNCDI